MVGKLISDIAEVVKRQVPWIDELYTGVSLVTTDGGSKPVAHISHGEYISVLPDDRWKAMGYIELDDPIIFTKDKAARYKFNISLIVWLDGRLVNPGDMAIDDFVRETLVKALNNRLHKTTNIEIVRIFEKFSNIYNKYTITEADSQFLMRPYYAIKLELSVTQRDGRCEVNSFY